VRRRGARSIFDRVAMVQLELARKPSYEGQAELSVMANWISELGFEVVKVDPAGTDSAGIIRAIDVIFARVRRSNAT